MSASLMLECEIKESNGWVARAVSSIRQSGQRPDIRCVHCHGRVKVHMQQVPHGPADHVEHLSRQDSEGCRGGHHFKGAHQMSKEPVA